jgi:hypothetical protein
MFVVVCQLLEENVVRFKVSMNYVLLTDVEVPLQDLSH